MALEHFDGNACPETEAWLCPRCKQRNEFHPEVLRIVEKYKSKVRCQRCDRPSSLAAWRGAKGAEGEAAATEPEEKSEAEMRDDQEE